MEYKQNEIALIQLGITHPAKIQMIFGGMTPEKFDSPFPTQFLIEHIRECVDKEQVFNIDFAKSTIAKENKDNEEFPEDWESLMEMAKGSGAEFANLELYQAGIEKEWRRGFLIGRTTEFESELREEDVDSDEAYLKFKEDIDQASVNSAFGSPDMTTLIAEGEQEERDVYEGKTKPYNLTGFPKFDAMFGRMSNRGDVINVAARAGHGKTSFVTVLLESKLAQDGGFFYGSAEMTALELINKVIQSDLSYPTAVLENGLYFHTKAMTKAVQEARERFVKRTKGRSEIRNMELSLPEVIKTVYHFYHNFGTDLFIFDRIELFKEVQNAKGTSDEAQAARKIQRQLRSLAKKLKVCIVPIIQGTQDASKSNKGMVTPAHVMGGIAASTNATKFIGLFNPYAEDAQNDTFPVGMFKGSPSRITVGNREICQVEWRIWKNTNGSKGSVLTGFDPITQKFYDLGIARGAATTESSEKWIEMIEKGNHIINPVMEVGGSVPGTSNGSVAAYDPMEDDEDNPDFSAPKIDINF